MKRSRLKIAGAVLGLGLFLYIGLRLFDRATRNFPYYKSPFHSPAVIMSKEHKLASQSAGGEDEWILYLRIENFDTLPAWIKPAVLKEQTELYKMGIYKPVHKDKEYYEKTKIGDRVFVKYWWEGKGTISSAHIESADDDEK